MCKLLLAATLTLAACAPTTSSAGSPSPPSAVAAASRAPLELSFDDGFKRRPSPQTWRTTFKSAGAEPSSLSKRSLYGNRERQVYFDPDFLGLGVDPFTVRNGKLIITARKMRARERRAVDGALRTLPLKLQKTALKDVRYASGLLTTKDHFEQQYGYFEMRARWTHGKGLWPAFWLLPANGAWPPEIDVVEALGHDSATVYQSIHSKADGKRVSKTRKAAPRGGTGRFHTYGVLWTEESVRFYIDGVESNQAPTPKDAHRPMYLLVNLAIGGHWPGDPGRRTRFPARMEIDHIRAWRFKDQASASLPSSERNATMSKQP
ncbi:MAG: glycoside hydrolase family 16 protein [Caulobacter sp.]